MVRSPYIVNKMEKIKEVKQPELIDLDKMISTFNLQTKLSKIKIFIPFNEFLINREYKDKIIGMVRN